MSILRPQDHRGGCSHALSDVHVSVLREAQLLLAARLRKGNGHDDWLSWAASWAVGERSPGRCVDVGHECFSHKGDPVWHALGQLAWAAKEACYDTPKSGWLTVFYIADAMIAFGVAFPTDATTRLVASDPHPLLQMGEDLRPTTLKS